jgi:predicted dehydrogenase
MSDVSIGLAGAGYWGSKLARNVFEASGCRLAVVADPDEDRRDAAVERHPGSRGVPSLEELLGAGDVDAVILATPAAQHADHIRAALEAGKHVLVEKPLALSVADAESCLALAEESGLTLMVGHTFLYSEPVRVLRRLIADGELGRVLYVYAQRLNLGVIRQDLNALWNFGPHDVSILLYLLDAYPERVSARVMNVLEHGLEDVAFMVLEFPGGVVGHIHESWLDPRKVRQITVVGDSKMAVYDDTNVEEPLAIYDKGVTREDVGMAEFSPSAPQSFGEFKLQVRAGDVVVPRVAGREPLRVEIEHFASCVAGGERPLSDAAHGRDVVAVLEAAQRSAAANGEAVPVQEALGVHSPA